jgi:hypothetical protein
MFKIFLILQILFCCSYAQYNLIINDVYKQYENIAFEFVTICDIPLDVFSACHLPFLNTGHIETIKDNGIIWCSSKSYDSYSDDDSCYVVVKTKLSYNVEWWKTSSKKFVYIRTQHVSRH